MPNSVQKGILKRKVFIIDDDISDLETMKSILEGKNYEVFVTSDGINAAKLVKQHGPDLILVDIMMPLISGYDILRSLRKSFNNDVKIAFVSILPKSEVNLRNADGFIQKPFDVWDFLEQVDDFF